MKKLILIFVVILSACTQAPPGNYYIIPVTGTLQGTVEHVCRGEECWNVAVYPTETVIPPTQEHFPTSTPTATNTPIPPLGPCVLVVNTPTLNVRAQPNGTILGQVHQGDMLSPDVYVTANGIRWYHIYFDVNSYGYVHSAYVTFKEGTDCSAVPFESTALCVGWHSVPIDVNLNDMQASFVTWKEKGQCVSAKGMEEIHAPSLALAFNGIGIVRFARGPLQNGDCANVNLPPQEAALDMWNRTKTVALTTAPPSAGFWVELDNECQGIYFKNLNWLDEYLSTEIELFGSYYPKVVFGTMLAGAWTQDYVNALTDTWDTALKYHACLGIHAGSPLANYYAVDGLTIPWLWKYSYQHRDIRRWLTELNPRYAQIPFCVTEWASGGGWAPYQPNDFYSWAQTVENDGIITANGFTAGVWNSYGVNGHMLETALLW